MKLIILSLLVLMSCGKPPAEKSSIKKQNPSAYYSSSKVSVKVFYEPGAEPFVQEGLVFKTWTILEKNLEALFLGRTLVPQIEVPKELSDMSVLPPQNKSKWSMEAAVALAKRSSVSSDPASFEIYFVNGHASDGDNVIGFHLSGTKIIMIFKDVIRSSGSGPVPKYVEQATLVHEIGHALGLVNNGTKMQTEHQDKAHGAHCNEAKCVMYYSNEGTSGMMSYVQQIIQTGDLVMFDDKCLQDARSY